MKKYEFRICIIGVPRVYRVIEATENCTFSDLHAAIFKAFDRYDAHLYSFFITGKDTKDMRMIYNSPEITHPQNVEDLYGFGKSKKSASKTRIGDAGLKETEIFHYLFDFGDDWWHRIRVQKIDESKHQKKHIKLIKSVGKSPDQYPDYDDEYEE